MTPTTHPALIAGKLDAAAWARDRDRAQKANTPDAWRTLFDTFLQQRLHLRYLRPIELLQANDKKLGEGFSMVALQCTLIEFLAAYRTGKAYVHGAKETDQVYSDCQKIFWKFLRDQAPFSAVFSGRVAKDFYASVRCGLLHEARTKNDWRIKASTNGKALPIEAEKKFVYRNDFQDAIKAYIARYREEVAYSAEFQNAFIRKFDSLAQA